MAVTWVGGTSFSQTTGTSLAANAPASLADGDLLLAGVIARSAITPPSGWTLVDTTGDFTDGVVSQRLSVYKKDATTSGDSSASFTWAQASSAVLAVAYAAARGADTSPASSAVAFDEVLEGYLGVYAANVPATADGQLMIVFCSTTEGDPSGGDVSSQAGFTSFTQPTASDYRLAGFYRAVNTGQGVGSGLFFLDGDYEGFDTFGLGAITLLLDEGSGSVDGIISAPSPLGDVQLLGSAPPTAMVSVESPLGAVAALGWHDFSGAINAGGSARYYMDLVTPDGDVRVPISSWQGTLQVGAAQYVQCVVPAVDVWVDDIAAATAFRITRLLTLTDGGTLEYLVVECPLDTIQYARGSTNYTATLSGYLPAPAEITWPEGTERELVGVRTVFTYPSGLRIRCSIDWLLQPGQAASFGEATFDAAYINFIVSETDAYMDVGQRIEAE